MSSPLVTVIALSYNQAPYIREALDSVKAQTYPHLQVILVDDGSQDNSAEILKEYAAKNPEWELLLLPKNIGNTSAFNQAFKLAKGKYIIDFALDDVMLPGRISFQVSSFEQQSEKFGVLYTNATLIDQSGNEMGLFYPDKPGKKRPTPSGDVFAQVLAGYFICTPTVILRKEVLDELGGYDETLAYEDFDLFVRASRNWHFCYLSLPLTKKRIWKGSMSQGFYRKKQLRYFQSTWQVCLKAAGLVKTEEEKKALAKRLKFELRQAVFTEHPEVVPGYVALLAHINRLSVLDKTVAGAAKLGLPLALFFRFYHKIKGSAQVT